MTIYSIDGPPLTYFETHQKELKEKFEQPGLMVFPGLLEQDSIFQSYHHDIYYALALQAQKYGIKPSASDDPCSLVTELAQTHRNAVGYVYDLGTCPNKFISGIQLKCHPYFIALVRLLLGKDILLATPTLSDTLHIFPPGDDNFKYNLPVHQDFPYILQSPRQITICINLGSFFAGIGGMTLWEGSHKFGVCEVKLNNNGHYQSVIDKVELNKYQQTTLECGIGDVAVLNSLILHRSEKNMTPNRTRIIQLYRYSDLSCSDSMDINWASSEKNGQGAQFKDLYPDKFKQHCNSYHACP